MKLRITNTATAAFFASIIASYGQANLTWDSNTGTTGAQDGAGAWNTTNTNWWNGSTNVSFVAGDNVTFGAASGAAGTVTVITGGLTTGNLTFNQTGSSSYEISGGSITGGALVKNGSMGLRLNSANSFTSVAVTNGPNSQTDGAIRIGIPDALGTAPITFSNTASMTGLYFLTGFGNASTFANNIQFTTASTAGLTNRLLLTSNTAGGPQVVTLSGQLTGGASTSKVRTDGTVSAGQSVARLTNAANTVTLSEWEMWRGGLEITSDGALGNSNNALRLNVGATGDPAGTGFRFGANNITIAATRNFIVQDRTNVNTQTFTGSRIDSPVTFTGQMVKKGTTDLILAGTNTGAGGLRLDAGTVSLFNSGAAGTGAVTHAGGSLRFSFGDGTTTTWSNNVALNATGHTTFIIRGTNDAAPTVPTTVRLTGLISGGAAGQAYTIAQTNVSGNHNNVLILDNASNSFSGQVAMDRGTLAITSNAALGNANNGIRINTWNLNGALRFDADNITLPTTRAIALADGSNLSPINTQAFTSTIEGVISGTGTLVKQGAGNLILTASNTATGPTTVSNGTLEISGSGSLGAATNPGALSINGTLRFNTSANQTFNGALSGSGSLIKQNTGTLIFNGSGSFAGTTAVEGGTLLSNGSSASNISVASGATFGGSGSTTGSLTFAGGSNFSVGLSEFSATGGVTINGPVSVEFAAAPIPGIYPILEYGVGGLTGSVANLTTASGRATFADDPGSSSIVATIATGTRTWAVNDGNWDIGTSLSFAEDDQKFFSGDSLVFPTRPTDVEVTLVGDLVPFEVTADHSNNYLFSGTGVISGPIDFTKRGTGTLTISTANTYTGFTYLEEGIIEAAHPSAFGTSSLVLDGGSLQLGGQSLANTIDSFGGAITGTGTLTGTLVGNPVFAGGTVTLTGSVSNGTITIAPGTALSVGNGGTTGSIGTGDITVDTGSVLSFQRSNALTAANAITGAGLVRQAGAAALTLSGTNTHSGGTEVASSSLVIPNSTALGTGSLSILSGAASGTGGGVSTVLFNNTAAVSIGNNIVMPAPGVSSTYTLMKASSGQLTGTQLNLTGVISGGNANSVLRLNSNTGGDRTTSFRLAGVNTLEGSIELYRGAVIITNNQSLGSARLALNGNNNTDDGDVRFENPVTLSNEIALVNTSNPDPIHTGGHTVTLNGPITGVTGGAAMVKIGTGKLVLSGPTTFTADTRIESGTLALAGSATLASSPIISVSAGADFDISAIEGTYSLGDTQTLRGLGAVNGAFTALGTLSPGAAVNTLGTLTFNEGLEMDTAAGLFQIDTTNGQSDRLIVTGDVTAANSTALTITDIAAVPVVLPPATKIALIEYTGTFTGLVDINADLAVADGATITIGGNSFVVNYDDTSDGVTTGKFLTLTVPGAPPAGFSVWAAANAGGAEANPGDDFDNDGVPNGVEYFMGQTGSSFTANPAIVTTEGIRTVTWPRDPAAAATFAVETSSTLSSWNTITPPDASIDTSTSTQVVYTLPAGTGPLFVRLAVTPAP
jgi:fibronectin-binding autotransporter adhesin